jgi:type IV pilus assembly protein PilW
MNSMHDKRMVFGHHSQQPIDKSLIRGLTMVELLVAMTLSLLIALAAISSLTVTRRGFTTIDAASQLRDNGRFAAELIQRLGVQSGFKDVMYAGRDATDINANTRPNVTGFDNALSSSSDPLNSSTARTPGVAGYGSDVLILGNQLVRRNDNSPDADGSMIDCNGNTLTTNAAPFARDNRTYSILSVAVSNGEPSLMCSTVDANGTISANPQPIIEGVENFQVLYGTEDVTAGTAPASTYGITAGAVPNAALDIFIPDPPTAADTTALQTWRTAWATWEATINKAPNKYLRADQLAVTTGSPTQNAIDTFANWRRVRSLRIGIILRGAPNSAQNSVPQTLYPFGSAKSGSSGTVGSALSSTTDIGTVFSAPTDGRLRQVLTFTVHLRNDQGL